MVTLSNSVSRSALLERSKQIFDEVRAGRFEHSWCKLVLTDDVNTLEVMVSCDALKMPVRTVTRLGAVVEDAHTRISVDAFTQQEIADELGAVLLTPKLVDEIYRQSAKLSPSTRDPGPQMASAAELIRHSQTVDSKAQGASSPPALANVGKDWVIAKAVFTDSAITKNRAANYGWLGTGTDRSVTGLSAIQSIGTHHTAGGIESPGHVDYSQVARFAHRGAKFNEAPVDLALIYTGDAPGTALVSHEGPLPSSRLPQANGAPPPGIGPFRPPPEPPPPPPGSPGGGGGGGGGAVLVTSILGGGVGYAVGGPAGAIVGSVVGGIVGLIGRKP